MWLLWRGRYQSLPNIPNIPSPSSSQTFRFPGWQSVPELLQRVAFWHVLAARYTKLHCKTTLARWSNRLNACGQYAFCSRASGVPADTAVLNRLYRSVLASID